MPTEIKLERIQDKYLYLKNFFANSFSINDLVNIAGSDSLGRYICTMLFRNKTLSKQPTRRIRSQGGLLSWSGDMGNHLLTRAQQVNTIINAYNNTQKDKLRIIYSQDNFPNVDLSFDKIFLPIKAKWYLQYNITRQNLIEYLSTVNARIGLVQIINLFLTRQYLILNNKISILDFCDDMTTQLVDQNIIRLTQNNLKDFFEKLKNEIFSVDKIDIWISYLREWAIEIETFGLEFNINNREQNTNQKTIFKPVGQLSLGQKVVAMLSFVLSYSEYSNDFTPLIIDQPEDNLDNQYIYKNLVKDLREMKGKRQVIIATHSSTIVTNAKAEQVIVMESDNEHGWVCSAGYPTNPATIKHIINHLEGGNSSFKHKSFIYGSVLNDLH